MITDKKIQESSKIIKKLIIEGKIRKPKPAVKAFFLGKAINSVDVAKRLFQISSDPDDNINGYMWVINAAYYSMFFAATALLAHYNHSIIEENSKHSLTYHALVFYFIIEDNKLQKHIIKGYNETLKDAKKILQIAEEKAKDLIHTFNLEKGKRSDYTYELGYVAEKNKAKTSVERAIQFLIEVRKILEQ